MGLTKNQMNILDHKQRILKQAEDLVEQQKKVIKQSIMDKQQKTGMNVLTDIENQNQILASSAAAVNMKMTPTEFRKS